MNLRKRLIACTLIIAMLTATPGLAAWITPQQGENSSALTIVDDKGKEQVVDQSWDEDYPYGIFALGNSQLLATEGGAEQVLTVHRLGGTTGKASAVLYYQPAVTQTEGGGKDYSSAISADDVIIQVADPLPITQYQPWGMDPDPEETDVKVTAAPGVDGEGESCTILSLDQSGDTYQWYSLQDGTWTEVAFADGPELPVGEDELKTYDFRCIFTVNDTRYCTDSYQGEAYTKPAPQEIPEAPDDIELNPEPTYSTLDLSQGSTPYDGILFEVCFAQGESEKKIRIQAVEDGIAELDEFSTLTITDCVGGQVMDSMNTLMLRLQDEDGSAAAPAELGFAVTEASFDKSEGVARLNVMRTGGMTQTLSVDWSLEDGSAAAGVDYVADSGTLYFYGSQTEQTIEIALINDQVESTSEKTLTVHLSNLRGDDASSLSEDTCTLKLYNSNTATDLNLASTLYDVDAVDISSGVSEHAGATVNSSTVTGTQVTSDEDLGSLSEQGQNSTVNWGSTNGAEIAPMLWDQYGRISFRGGDWDEKVTERVATSSNGTDDHTSVSKDIPYMGARYQSMYTVLNGGAGFANWWKRTWFGMEEYAYTYFAYNVGGVSSRWDCEPEYSTSFLMAYLDYFDPNTNTNSWNYSDSSSGSITVGVDIFDQCCSDDNINASADVKLTRRTFSNDFKLDLYTANDLDIAEVAKYANSNYQSIIDSIKITEGGTRNGKLYEGSSFNVLLGNTHLTCTKAYIVNSQGISQGIDGSISNNSITFSNVMLPPSGTYTVRLVLTRAQDINVDVSTSSEVDATGQPVGGEAKANRAAHELLLSKNTAGGTIMVGYTPITSGLPSKTTIATKSVRIPTVSSSSDDGIVTLNAVTDLQYINFNLSDTDIIIFNGKAFAGNENIWLTTKDLTPASLTFRFYEEDYLTAERPMKVTIDSTAIYYDGNANGRIDGHFDEDAGSFIVDAPDEFVCYLSSGDYEETMFQPVVDGDKTYQYFMRPYYTANPVSITVPQGHSESERMQIMPNFITDVTNSSAYQALTTEQKQYRTVISGQSSIKRTGSSQITDLGYTADNHFKYTAAAAAYSYVDIPLGGDTSPSRPATNTDLGTEITDGYVTIGASSYMMRGGLAYYYSATAPGNLGDAVYVWTPDYAGNLLYPFSSPSPVNIEHSLAGSNLPITTSLDTYYLKLDGSWTKAAPTESNKSSYSTNSLGKYITEARANTAGAAALNGYLGSFGDNDTFALVVNEQSKTTDKIIQSRNTRNTRNGDSPTAETVTRGTIGAFPNSEYLKQNSGSQAQASGSSEGKGEYEEFSADTNAELFSFSADAFGVATVSLDGYEIHISVGLPLPTTDEGDLANPFKALAKDTAETGSAVADFIRAVKAPKTAESKSPLKKLAGEELNSNKLKSKSVDFSLSVSLALTLKYNPMDNVYLFSEGAMIGSAGLELRLQYRFTPVPIIYVYAQFGAEVSLQTGLAQDREVVLGKAIVRNEDISLYETPKDGESRQYYFTTDQKAFNITFTGRLYIESYEFSDSNGDGQYNNGELLGDKLAGFHSGYLSSDGKEPTQVMLKTQNGFTLAKPVVVVFTVMDDGDDNYNATSTISSIVLINDMTHDLYWQGLHLDVEGSIELGVGIGVEIAKAEIFAKGSIGLAFTFGGYNGEDNDSCTFDEFNLSAALGFRLVFLFFNYEQDLIEVHLQYDGIGDEWTHGWSALGGQFGSEDAARMQSNDTSGKIPAYITPPSQVRARAYSNNVTQTQTGISPMAFDPNTEEFQVSGYGSSVNAFKLLDKVSTGYDYQIVTLGNDNYVVYTGTYHDSDAAEVDNTELQLSKLLQYDDVYGFVNPIAGNSTASEVSLPVDGDGTGDLDFYAWPDEDGKTIHVAWVSYAQPQTTTARPDGDPYGEMTKDNYATVATPAGGIYVTTTQPYTYTAQGDGFVVNGTTMTANNYRNMVLDEVLLSGDKPNAEDYFTTTPNDEWKSEVEEETTYYYPDTYTSLADAKDAYLLAEGAYQNSAANHAAYTEAQASYEDWAQYYAWYNYFAQSDIQNQVTAASRNTVVKYATFDAAATEDSTAFTPAKILSDPMAETYYFLPQRTGAAVTYAQSVPYSQADLDTYLGEYEAYLDSILTTEGSDNSDTTRKYLDSTKAFRLAYQQSMLSVYGGNSKLTITAPDGSPYLNGVMYVSKHQENGAGVAENQTNEILTSLETAQIGDTYYLSYVTQQDKIEKSGGAYTDLASISRLYLRTFTIDEDKSEVVWGDPYLLRTVVNKEQTSTEDGVYDATSGLKTHYQDSYLSNLHFLSGKLGNKLVGEKEDFTPFSTVPEETFLLFEMNGNTYVIDQESLVSISSSPEHSGTIYPFFTYQQHYHDALEEGSTENLSSGKSEVIIGADGDGNVAAVYTGSVPNTVNNAIYIAYWDPDSGAWSDGVMLAMNHMDVYERAVANRWDADTTEKAYFDTELGGGMDQFTFSNLQIALGRKDRNSGSDGQAIDSQTTSKRVRQTVDSSTLAPYSKMATANSSTPEDIYALSEQAELDGTDTGTHSAAAPELLILTQGAKLELKQYESDSGNTIIAPKRNAANTAAQAANMGIYAISYGKGEQQVGSVAVNFDFTEFTAGTQLYASVGLKNVGDAAIRGGKLSGQEITVSLKLYDEDGSHDTVMAQWKIPQSIGAGQTVALATTDGLCKALPDNLGAGDYFYVTVEESQDYIEGQSGGTAYRYDSSTEAKNLCAYKFLIEDKPELAVENLQAQITGVAQNGNAQVELSFDATNRGKEKAEEVFVQFAYISDYDADGNEIYAPLNLTSSELYISQQKLIPPSISTFGVNNLSSGVLYLGTDDTFYTKDYYITAEAYKLILSRYYSTTEVSGWTKGTYGGNTYWYDAHFYPSAYAAYTAGQKAVESWSYDTGSKTYYNNSYASYSAAKAAADAARRQEYVLTTAQYTALPQAEQENWKLSDQAGSYIPVGYANYAAADAAYKAALKDISQEVDKNYLRNVQGTLDVPPQCFNGNLTGSLNLRVTVFSKSSSAGVDANGLYSSNHTDEYFSVNNLSSIQLEQKTDLFVPSKITLALGATHQLPVNIRTTTGKAPVISTMEVDDGADELSTLYYSPDTDTDNVAATASGSLVIVGNELGSGVIHILDAQTNSTQAIAYTVAPAGSGINIYNDDAQFTFYNADGSLYDSNKTGQSWKFQPLSSWTEQSAVPYLGNIAIGEPGAYFTFTTKASELTFDLIGSANVKSNMFPGTYSANNTGASAPPTSKAISFKNESSITHTITVTVTDDTAYFDTVHLEYGSDYEPPSSDIAAPGLYWSRSFPTANSLAHGEEVEFTVYAVDDSGLQSMSFNGTPLNASQMEQAANGLWSYTFTVKENTPFSVSATDTNGNTTSRSITVDWFAQTAQNPEFGQKPRLNASIYKVNSTGGNAQDLFADGANVTFTSKDLEKNNRVEFQASTDVGATLSYYKYDVATATFAKMTNTQVSQNGYYMVRADEATYGTWTEQLFYVDCFESMPVINVENSALTAPNGWALDWVASKDAESTAKLNMVTLNGISLLSPPVKEATSHSGDLKVYYGGEYLFEARDSKNIIGRTTLNLSVPLDISQTSIFAWINPWGQPDADGTRHGSITLDFNGVTGGDYSPQSRQGAKSLDDYYGSYEYVILPAADCEGKPMPGDATLVDGEASWLSALTWTAAEHDKRYTVDGLRATADGSSEYVVLLRDKANPSQYSTMAKQSVTLSDNAIDVASLSARLASTTTAADGQVFTTAYKGPTGAYEFAILPLEKEAASAEGEPVYLERTATDFQQPDVRWYLTDWASDEGTSATFGGLVPGGYQVAIRALYNADGTELEQMNALSALNQNLTAATSALKQVEHALDSTISAMGTDINSALTLWRTATETTAECKSTYEQLKAKFDSGDPAVTSADVTAAQEAWQAAIAAEAAKESAYKESLTGASPEQLSQILTLCNTWLSTPEGNDKEQARSVYNEAVLSYCQTYQEGQYAAQLMAAQGALAIAQSTYDLDAEALSRCSAEQYANTANSILWDSMVLSSTVVVRSGAASSIKAVPSPTSSSSQADGSIAVTASGGSAYDGGETVHYQFATRLLKKPEDAVDYSENMAAIADLDLNWQFADDPAQAHQLSELANLSSNWYQVFVRVVYDPDIRDDYDVNTHLYDSTGAVEDLATLRASYDAAQKATEKNAIAAAANAAHTLYTVYQASQASEDYQAYLDAIGQDATVIQALEAWENAEETQKKSAYSAYRTALTDYFTQKAAQALDSANIAYLAKTEELKRQVDDAYTQTPGYYDTASYTTAHVGVRSSGSVADRSIIKVVYGDGEVTYTIKEGKDLSKDEETRIYNDNETLEVHLIIAQRHIVIPAGTLTDRQEVSEVIDNFQDGKGNVVAYTPQNAEQEQLVSISLVENGTISYVYLGRGMYRVVESSRAFDDLTGHWAKSNILFTAERALFQGVSEQLFAPDTTMTRAMVVTVLYRMMGQPETRNTLPFTDIPEGTWYTDAVIWGYENEIVAGISQSQFAPNLQVSREQLVTILHRFLLSTGFGATETASLESYPDHATVADFATPAFQWAVAADVIAGTDAGLLAPQADATRAQVAAVFERIVRYILA